MVMRVYRATAGVGRENIVCFELVSRYGFTFPALLVRQATLCLFARMVLRAPASLWCLLWYVRDAPSRLIARCCS